MGWTARRDNHFSFFSEHISIFRLHVNDKRYHVRPPPRAKSLEELSQLNDVRSLIAQVRETVSGRFREKCADRNLYSFSLSARLLRNFPLSFFFGSDGGKFIFTFRSLRTFYDVRNLIS